jgi:hypothetical protein
MYSERIRRSPDDTVTIGRRCSDGTCGDRQAAGTTMWATTLRRHPDDQATTGIWMAWKRTWNPTMPGGSWSPALPQSGNRCRFACCRRRPVGGCAGRGTGRHDRPCRCGKRPTAAEIDRVVRSARTPVASELEVAGGCRSCIVGNGGIGCSGIAVGIGTRTDVALHSPMRWRRPGMGL